MSEVGRPTLYRPEHCARVIELGREGYGKAEMAAELDVSRQTLEDWAKQYPEFLDAFTRAIDFSLAWWERKAKANLEAQTFQTSLWSRSMAARFPADYTERRQQELTGKDGKDLLPTAIEIIGVSAK